MDFSVLLGNNTRALASVLCTQSYTKTINYLTSTMPLSMNKSDLNLIDLIEVFHRSVGSIHLVFCLQVEYIPLYYCGDFQAQETPL